MVALTFKLCMDPLSKELRARSSETGLGALEGPHAVFGELKVLQIDGQQGSQTSHGFYSLLL